MFFGVKNRRHLQEKNKQQIISPNEIKKLDNNLKSIHLNTPEQFYNKENQSPNINESLNDNKKVIKVSHLIKSQTQKIDTEDVLQYSIDSVKYIKNTQNPQDKLDYSPSKAYQQERQQKYETDDMNIDFIQNTQQSENNYFENIKYDEIIQFLKIELETLQGQYKSIEQENQRFQSESQNYNHTNQQLQQIFSQINEKNKKLDDQLKIQNINFVKLQQKLQNFEKENQELKYTVKDLDNEKKNISLKWQKASGRQKIDEKLKAKVKELEQQIEKVSKENEENRNKYIQVNTELRIAKDSESQIKNIFEQKLNNLQEQWLNQTQNFNNTKQNINVSLIENNKSQRENQDLASTNQKKRLSVDLDFQKEINQVFQNSYRENQIVQQQNSELKLRVQQLEFNLQQMQSMQQKSLQQISYLQNKQNKNSYDNSNNNSDDRFNIDSIKNIKNEILSFIGNNEIFEKLCLQIDASYAPNSNQNRDLLIEFINSIQDKLDQIIDQLHSDLSKYIQQQQLSSQESYKQLNSSSNKISPLHQYDNFSKQISTSKENLLNNSSSDRKRMGSSQKSLKYVTDYKQVMDINKILSMREQDNRSNRMRSVKSYNGMDDMIKQLQKLMLSPQKIEELDQQIQIFKNKNNSQPQISQQRHKRSNTNLSETKYINFKNNCNSYSSQFQQKRKQ